VKPDLEPARAGVVPRLVVELAPFVVELEQAAVPAARLAPSHLLRKLRLDAFAKPTEELGRREQRRVYQPPEYIS